MDAQKYKELFGGFVLTDCSVRRRDIFYFILDEYRELDAETEHLFSSAEEPLTKVVVYFGYKPEKERWSWKTYRGFERLLGGAAVKPLEQFVGVDSRGQVCSFGSGKATHEASLPRSREGPQRGGIRKLKTIGGCLHASSGGRGLGRRLAESQWESLCRSLPFGEESFDDFDAFDNGEFYAVSEKQSVFRRGAEGAWEKLRFPRSYRPVGICCGKEGFAYIVTTGGTIFRGSVHEWQEIVRGSDWGDVQRGKETEYASSSSYDLVWHQGRVFGVLKGGLIEVTGTEARYADTPDGVSIDHLYVNDGVMLAAGEGGAAYHDGTAWHLLFSQSRLQDELGDGDYRFPVRRKTP